MNRTDEELAAHAAAARAAYIGALQACVDAGMTLRWEDELLDFELIDPPLTGKVDLPEIEIARVFAGWRATTR